MTTQPPGITSLARTVLLLGLVTACAGVPTAERTPSVGPGVGGTSAAPLPVPRSEVAGTAWGSALVVAGGFLRDGSSSAQVDAWTADEGWSRLPDLPEPRNHPGLAMHTGRLHLVGGYGPDGRASAKVWSLGEGADRWREEPSLPAARAAAAVVADGERLVVAGGVVDGRVSASVVLLSGGRWSAGPSLSAAREHLGGATAAGRVYAVAGRTGGLDTNLDVVESLGPGERAWRREPSLPRPRGGTAAGSGGDVVCVAGGEDPERTEPAVVCLREGAWREIGRLTEPRHGLAVVAVGGALHVVGGGPAPGLTVSGAHEVFPVP